MHKLSLTFLVLVLIFINGCSVREVIVTGTNPLFIPALIDSAEHENIELVLQKGQHEFYEGVASETMGVNGNYLGPSVKLHKGQTTRITFKNNIDETTTIHGHGLHVSGDIDGGPQLAIEPNEEWTIDLPVVQEAGTSWYHPHLMGKTGKHVYAGLAGIYLIEDDNAKSLGLPQSYGIDDIPLIVQDRSFTDKKMNPYLVSQTQMMDGFRGDTLVVNGTVSPYHIVPKGWVRLRLLNASNARFYRFYLSEQKKFYKIATEGGFLNAPILMTELTMGPGERNEIMIDLANIDNVHVMAEFLAVDFEDWSFFASNTATSVVELRTDSSLVASGVLPNNLNDIAYFTQSEKDQAVTRTFRLEMDEDAMTYDMHSMFSINGKSMDMQRIDERINKGQLELWSITAEDMPHPFHMHGVSFLIQTHNGNSPQEADKGWKDTVVVTNELTEVLMRFNHIADEKTPYMYHCHILEHEDGGMMGQFTVE